MKSTKLPHVRGAIQKFHLDGLLHSARRVLEAKSERLCSRPLHDIDGWSDQAEVAFYEETYSRRA